MECGVYGSCGCLGGKEAVRCQSGSVQAGVRCGDV